MSTMDGKGTQPTCPIAVFGGSGTFERQIMSN